MLKPKRFTSEPFADGRLTVLEANEGVISAESYKFPYGYKTVGIKRFYNAQVAGSTIESLVAIPYNTKVKQKDLIELLDFETGDKLIYRIEQIQIKDTAPKSLYLTLIKDGVLYDDNRT